MRWLTEAALLGLLAGEAVDHVRVHVYLVGLTGHGQEQLQAGQLVVGEQVLAFDRRVPCGSPVAMAAVSRAMKAGGKS